jgi:hypothetical protein
MPWAQPWRDRGPGAAAGVRMVWERMSRDVVRQPSDVPPADGWFWAQLLICSVDLLMDGLDGI